MRKSRIVLFGLVLIVGCAGREAPEEKSAATAVPLRVGVSAGTVNPANGTFLAGYEQDRRSTGIHDDLHAKAVVFDDGDTSVALVIVDSIGVQYDTVQQIRRLAADKAANVDALESPLSPERIVVASTHTHCSPDVIGIYGPDETHTGRDSTYMNLLVETAAEQVAEAAEALEPATLVFAETQCTGWAVNDSEPGVVDNSVTILQCLDGTGEPIATLTSFACHPTVLDGDTTQVSSDWVGTFYDAMEAQVPGEHLFLQGSVGGWIQPQTPERTFPLAERYGKDLAAKALEALQDTTPVTSGKVRFDNAVFGMPNENELFKQISAGGLNLVPRPLGDAIETEVAWFAIGDAQFATHPGETAPAFTWATEDLMDTGPKFVLGLGLDQLGYILKPEYFDDPEAIPHALYLTNMSPGRDAGPSMMAALESIIP